MYDYDPAIEIHKLNETLDLHFTRIGDLLVELIESFAHLSADFIQSEVDKYKEEVPSV